MGKRRNPKTSVLMAVILLGLGWTIAAGKTIYPNVSDGPYASNPIPADGSYVEPEDIGGYPCVKLFWDEGEGSIAHSGYFSTDFDDVNDRVQDANLGAPYGSLPGLYYVVGYPAMPPPANEPMVRGTTYYWCVDEFDGTGTWPGPIWSFTIIPLKAYNPSPPTGTIYYVDPDVVLSWDPGKDAQEHDVYFGTDFNDVNSRVYPNVDATVIVTNWDPPGSLALGTTYYWRIDEVHDRLWPIEPGTNVTGDVWEFATGGAQIFVDVAASGANDGTSWANAYNYLQDALADANSISVPVEIRVAEGIYTPDSNSADPNGTGDREATFQLINGVTLQGGYAGFGEPDPNARDIDLYETILNGDLDGNDVQVSDPCDLLTEPTRGENSYHVVTGSGTDPNAVLDGFTITAGNANGSDPHGWGGGMCNANESSPTVTNCTFSGNSACAGGGMYNDSSSPTVTNCTFICNSALADGGGMNNENSSPMVSNCAFIGNSTEDGGGMCNCSSSPTVTNCTFTGNSAISPDVHVLGGGGMCNVEYSSPTLTNCILWGNSSPEPNGPQIALKDNSTVSISYCDLQGGQTAIYKVGTNNSVIWGEGNIDADPNFVDPNGPDAIAGTEDDDLRLSAGSPCIDAGDNTAVPPDTADLDGDSDTSERTPLDLDGLDRFVDDPNTGDTGVILPASYPDNVDMGAYEWYGGPACGDAEHPYPPGDLSGPDGVRDCYVDFFDFAVFAAHWLEYTGLE